ncbi:hypothetical protein [Endozoicomonas sp. SCSIO W0465]|uniref:hypothetical protein n=1 Tax=Endozoicomonas sp. SCSIO W0465 TaxID=2918516 RepID=UPI0020765CAD|nr:hypothetical protein [Endozoicomonas sp. SCSIO W0465]USE37661.1 hypothetical protein MJO57_05495 [Endozoicomonas sp. SCSIO W0465]
MVIRTDFITISTYKFPLDDRSPEEIQKDSPATFGDYEVRGMVAYITCMDDTKFRWNYKGAHITARDALDQAEQLSDDEIKGVTHTMRHGIELWKHYHSKNYIQPVYDSDDEQANSQIKQEFDLFMERVSKDIDKINMLKEKNKTMAMSKNSAASSKRNVTVRKRRANSTDAPLQPSKIAKETSETEVVPVKNLQLLRNSKGI